MVRKTHSDVRNARSSLLLSMKDDSGCSGGAQTPIPRARAKDDAQKTQVIGFNEQLAVSLNFCCLTALSSRFLESGEVRPKVET